MMDDTGWEVDMHLYARDVENEQLHAPCFFNERTRYQVIKDEPCDVRIYAHGVHNHIAIVADCRETLKHTPQERVMFLENIKALIDMQLLQEGETNE